MSHVSEYSYTDIRILGLWCESCSGFFFGNTEIIPCRLCDGEARLYGYLTPEQVDIICDLIEDCCHSMREMEENYDKEEEMELHKIFENRLQEHDWWHGNRGQLQYMWYDLREQPWSCPGYYNCARRYFAKAYTETYDREDGY